MIVHIIANYIYLVVDKEALDQDLRIISFGRSPQLFVLQFDPSSLVVSDSEKRNFDPTEEFVFVIFVFVVHRQLQDVVNVLHVTGKYFLMKMKN